MKISVDFKNAGGEEDNDLGEVIVTDKNLIELKSS